MLNKKIKVSIIVGTRPQLIKISPLIQKIKEDRKIELQFINTGQHYDQNMDEIFLTELNLTNATYLNLDVKNLTPVELIGKLMISLEDKLKSFKPDFVIVIGDTNSALAGAITASKLGIPLGHIEAGLRSFDRNMPEEINRVVIDHISDILFAPTKNAVENLKKEGISDEKIKFVYDITVDVLHKNREISEKKSKIIEKLNLSGKDFVLATAHRQESVDFKERLEIIVDSLIEISKEKTVVFPVHPRTVKNLKTFNLYGELANEKNIILLEPVGYFDFLALLSKASCIITDSGGIQKEALILGTPCITIRTTTEWTETIETNANILVGYEKERIINEVKLRATQDFKNFVKNINNPYGDGKTSDRIIDEIKVKINSLL